MGRRAVGVRSEPHLSCPVAGGSPGAGASFLLRPFRAPRARSIRAHSGQKCSADCELRMPSMRGQNWRARRGRGLTGHTGRGTRAAAWGSHRSSLFPTLPLHTQPPLPNPPRRPLWRPAYVEATPAGAPARAPAAASPAEAARAAATARPASSRAATPALASLPAVAAPWAAVATAAAAAAAVAAAAASSSAGTARAAGEFGETESFSPFGGRGERKGGERELGAGAGPPALPAPPCSSAQSPACLSNEGVVAWRCGGP